VEAGTWQRGPGLRLARRRRDAYLHVMYEIRMPAPGLERLIENYWFVLLLPGESADLSVDTWVDARADLVLSWGAPYTRSTPGRPARMISHSTLDAQRTGPMTITQRGAIRTLGVHFTPGGVGAFAVTEMNRFTDLTPPPSRVLGPDSVALERDAEALGGDVEAIRALLDAWFLAHRSPDPALDAFLEAKTMLEDSAGRMSIAETARCAGVSQRTLARLFQRFLGFSPKLFARIARFQAVMKRLMLDPGCSLGSLAAETGYFDQAHLARDFRRFSGGVPRAYKGYYPPQAPRDFAPNLVQFVQDDRAPFGDLSPTEESMAKNSAGSGTKDDPWKLKTPPGTSEYTIYRDDESKPPLLVCQVGKTTLTYDARCIDDLASWLRGKGDWVPLGSADEGKEPAPDTVEAWGRSAKNPVKGWYGRKKGLRGRFGMYIPPLMEALGLAEVEHQPKNNRMRIRKGV
jgi:AraC-like DNA-binding protein